MERKLPKFGSTLYDRLSKHEKAYRRRLKRGVVSGSAKGCATTNYKDNRKTNRPVSGGLPDTNRRRH